VVKNLKGLFVCLLVTLITLNIKPDELIMITSIVILKRFAKLLKGKCVTFHCPECGTSVDRERELCSSYCQYRYMRDLYPEEYY
jgi:hypothetical protein